MIKFSATPIAIVVAMSVVPPAIAKDKSWPIGKDQYHVYYRDLDMKDSGDRAEMLSRVEVAAMKMCKDRMRVMVEIRRCVTEVVAKSAPRSPMLRLAMSERDARTLAAR